LITYAISADLRSHYATPFYIDYFLFFVIYLSLDSLRRFSPPLDDTPDAAGADAMPY